MKRLLIVLFFIPSIAWAQVPVTSYPAPWLPVGNTVDLAVSNSSNNVQMGWVVVSPTPPPSTAYVCNTGAVNAYVLVGGSLVVVTTGTGTLVAAGVCLPLAVQGQTNLAGITASGNTSLSIQTGNGSPMTGIPGGGGGAPVPIPNNTVMGNTSGGTAFPTAQTSPLTCPVVGNGVADDTAAIVACVAAARGSRRAVVYLPSGQYLLSGSATLNLQDVEIDCLGPLANGNTTAANYGTTGGTFWLTSTSQQPITVAGGVIIRGCNFYWPNQTSTGTPITVTASPFTYANSTGAPRVVSVAGGTVSDVSINGVTQGTTAGTYNVPDTQSIVVTYTVAPTMGSWSPIVYPPLFTNSAGTQLVNFDLDHVRIINAYDVINQTGTTGANVIGAIHLTDTAGYAINSWFKLANTPEFNTVEGMIADSNLFQNAANVGKAYAQAWTAANGYFLRVSGNGNGTAASTVTVLGFLMTNSGVFGYQRGIWVDGTGTLGEAKFSNVEWDGVAQPLRVDNGGCITEAILSGGYYAYTYLAGGADNATAFSINPATTGCVASVDISGQLGQAQGDVLDLSGSAVKQVRLSLSAAGGYAKTTRAGTYYFANINAAGAIVDIIGSHIEPNTPGSSSRGVLAASALSVTLTGNSFNGVYNPVDTTGFTGAIAGAGNVSTNTNSTYDLVGDGDSIHRMLVGNKWQKGSAPPALSSCGTSPGLVAGSSDLRGVITVGNTATGTCTITFGNAFSVLPSCIMAGSASVGFKIGAASGSAYTVSAIDGVTDIKNTTLVYNCGITGQ